MQGYELGQTVDGGLIHLELQSSNDAEMPFRMLEYCMGVQRLFGQFPRQILLYVDEAPMHMETNCAARSCRSSTAFIAILARLRDDREAVHRIVKWIALLPAAEGETALAQLTILAGLRHLARTAAGDTEHAD
ncbi:MAG: hypothetical protein ABSG65_18580 [Bryobacteraceae bacterium]|jgi:hypothetical protein